MQYVMRPWWSCLCLVCLVQLAWSAPRYLAFDLGEAWTYNLNDAGDGAGTVVTRQQMAVRLRQGQPPTPLGTFTAPPFGGSQATAIGPDGRVVGCANGEGFGCHAFVWKEGEGLQDLGTLGELRLFSNATGINSLGVIVGYGDNPQLQSQPILWIHGVPQILPTLGGSAFADAINEQGDIVGAAFSPGAQTSHAVLWPLEGGIIDLHTLPATTSVARALTEDRRVVGYVDSQGFLWTSATGMQPLPPLPGDNASSATSINAAGIVVGTSIAYGTSPWDMSSHAVRWDAGVPLDLQGQLETPGWVLQNATGINAHGWILGQGVYHGTSHAVLLVPVPMVPPAPMAFFQEVQGDFNGDGWPDVAGIDPTTQIWVCLAGAAACTTVQGWGVQMVAGDLDGNGMDDLAVVAADTSLWVRLNGWSWQRVNGNLTQMVMGNFFGDGRQYLAGLASDTSIWVSSGLWPNGPNQLYGDWHQVTGFLSTLVVGDFTGSGRDQLAGCAVDTSLWFAGQVQPAGWMPWQQLPGYLVTLETVPGTPDTMQGVDAAGQSWCAPALGAWQPCPGGTLVALH